MDSARIADLLRPFLGERELAPAQIDALQRYLALLMRWNARMNLTAVRNEEHIVTRHIGESLFTARCVLPDVQAKLNVVDVGSGAGFPGLPLKIFAPAVNLTLVESQNKKATFLKEAVRAVHLDDTHVFADRAERFAEQFGGKADLVTMRAVERFGDVLSVAASLVSKDQGRPGKLALLLGEAQVEQTKKELSRFQWLAPKRIPLSQARCLLVGSAH